MTNLSSVFIIHVRRPSIMSVFIIPVLGATDRRNLEAPWLAILAYSMRFWPLRDPASKKTR